MCDGPLTIGIDHLVRHPVDDEDRLLMRSQGIQDTLRAGFPVGQGRVVQLYLDRASRTFGARDVILLSMLEPVLARLLRPTVRVDRLSELSGAERRVLSLVAEGGSNGDVACQLMVSEATVRKHLEHTYQKLGVANRTAAAALVHVRCRRLISPHISRIGECAPRVAQLRVWGETATGRGSHHEARTPTDRRDAGRGPGRSGPDAAGDRTQARSRDRAQVRRCFRDLGLERHRDPDVDG